MKKGKDDYGWYCIPDKDKRTDDASSNPYIQCQDGVPQSPRSEKYGDVKKIGQPHEKFTPVYNTWCHGGHAIYNGHFRVADHPNPEDPSRPIRANTTLESHSYLFDDAREKCMRACAIL